MRLVMKGGIWKNSEDEILKAAVMKYGKTQWARVSSLLPRKTAKQCKARWYEWLDPSIKKTEWSREEEERLLHLAKLMPSQWRTIAPLVGRTAGQCLEHYEKLLDMAQDKEVMDPRDDPRRLQPGEIDPAPETRPARPDPVDMDEDEKEMLSEARARLANTKGKKAKRKAREKQLEEAKRLAALQKRRELVAAGIEVSRRRVRRDKGIDYATEIPFQKLAPAGVYDVSEEDRTVRGERSAPNFLMKRLNEIEEERRDEEEARERAKDKRKFKKLGEANLAQAIMMTSQLNDPSMARKRSKLDLPAPQISDVELAEIAKAGMSAGALEDGSVEGSAATKALVGTYSAAPLPTPMRTPRLPPSQDVIMEEARNIVALNSAPTPLHGGANPELYGGTGFQGVAPMSRNMATPNPLAEGGLGGATPMRTPMGPGSVRGGLPGAGATPLRDQLSINAAEDVTTLAVYGSGSTLQERLRQKALRQELRAGLASLPEPQYTYEVVLPDAEEDAATETGTGSAFREDAADIDRRNAEAEAAAEAAAFERRSSALKREPALPRVTTIDDDVFVGVSKAESLISAELVELLHHDAVKFPMKAKPSRKVAPVLDAFSDAELASARAMVAQETTAVQAEFAAKCGGTLPSASQLYSLWQQMFDSHVFVPSLKAFAPQSVLTPEQVVEANRAEFDKLLHKLERDSKRVAKSEEKLTLITAGFEKRASAAVDDIRKFSAELEEKMILLECYKRLRAEELNAAPQRLATLTAELQDAVSRETELQAMYAQLAAEYEDVKSGRMKHSEGPNGGVDVAMD